MRHCWYPFPCFSSKWPQNRKIVSNKTKRVQSYGCQGNHNHISFELQWGIHCSSIQVHASLGNLYKFDILIISSGVVLIKQVMTGMDCNAHSITTLATNGQENISLHSTRRAFGVSCWLLPRVETQRYYNKQRVHELQAPCRSSWPQRTMTDYEMAGMRAPRTTICAPFLKGDHFWLLVYLHSEEKTTFFIQFWESYYWSCTSPLMLSSGPKRVSFTLGDGQCLGGWAAKGCLDEP